MNSNIPFVRQVAWISLLPQLVLGGIFIVLWNILDAEMPIINGSLTYLVLSFGLRMLIPHSHKHGIILLKQEKYLDAIVHFEKSYNFFTRNNWIDKYRYLTLLSSSKISYKEMALINIAFCYGQSGNGIKSKEYYERTLKEFPTSTLAKTAIKLINAIDHSPIKK